jgi:hypothetical protein
LSGGLDNSEKIFGLDNPSRLYWVYEEIEENEMVRPTLFIALGLLLAMLAHSRAEEDKPFPWRTDLEQAFSDAEEAGKPVLLTFR